jgi:hypothetical protein
MGGGATGGRGMGAGVMTGGRMSRDAGRRIANATIPLTIANVPGTFSLPHCGSMPWTMQAPTARLLTTLELLER